MPRKKENEMFNNKFKLMLDGTAGGGGTGTQTSPAPKTGDDGKGGATQQPATPLTYDAWLEKQPDDVKALLDTNVKGLKSALDSERGTREKLERELRTMAKAAEAGSEAQKKLTEMADEMSETDRRADFYDSAHKAGVGNLKLAYTVAVQEELFDSKGRVNFEAMKKDYPELFGATSRKIIKGNAGDGTEEEPPKTGGMNDFIRAGAGRKVG